MLPKPRRIVDHAALRAYQAQHRGCEILGCGAPLPPWPHHLVSVQRGGHDVPENLAALCTPHHMEWHISGRRTWLAKYATRLRTDLFAKVTRVVRLTGVTGEV